MKAIYDKFKSELVESCAPFWLKFGVDGEYGGILNCLDRYGKVYSEDKSVWMQGRCGWTFSYLYNKIEKKQEYLDFAKSCIDFARAYCIDKSDGRMFFTVTREGKPLRKRRYKFSETFYIIANAEYYMASGDGTYLDEAKKYFDFVYGMYKDPATDPYKITPKSYAETRNLKSLAEPMIMLNVSSIMRDADKERYNYYNDIITGLIEDIKVFYKPEYRATFETLTPENEVILTSSACRVINPGHDIECAWFLLEEAIKRGDEETAEFARVIFDDAFELGWDKEYGGITYFKDILGLPVEAYEHDMKLWWPQNETVIASLMLYKHTGDEKYKEIFDRVCDYAFTHFSDREYGEWLGYLRRDGKPTEPPCKGHTYKGPFHVMRMLAKCITILEDMPDKESN
ncbi:MAG: AGE family epimerase/isomerase [Clostridia bacterium]|nr:AGE family epimerase/isomerase [Clostridia bacterium]